MPAQEQKSLGSFLQKRTYFKALFLLHYLCICIEKQSASGADPRRFSCVVRIRGEQRFQGRRILFLLHASHAPASSRKGRTFVDKAVKGKLPIAPAGKTMDDRPSRHAAPSHAVINYGAIWQRGQGEAIRKRNRGELQRLSSTESLL